MITGVTPALSGRSEGRHHEGQTPILASMALVCRVKGLMTSSLGCRAAGPQGWQERRVKAKAGATAVPYPGHLDAHRTNAGVYLALRQGAIPDHRVAALGISSVSIPC